MCSYEGAIKEYPSTHLATKIAGHRRWSKGGRRLRRIDCQDRGFCRTGQQPSSHGSSGDDVGLQGFAKVDQFSPTDSRRCPTPPPCDERERGMGSTSSPLLGAAPFASIQSVLTSRSLPTPPLSTNSIQFVTRALNSMTERESNVCRPAQPASGAISVASWLQKVPMTNENPGKYSSHPFQTDPRQRGLVADEGACFDQSALLCSERNGKELGGKEDLRIFTVQSTAGRPEKSAKMERIPVLPRLRRHLASARK